MKLLDTGKKDVETSNVSRSIDKTTVKANGDYEERRASRHSIHPLIDSLLLVSLNQLEM